MSGSARVLLLHGFTSSRETVSALIEPLEQAGLEWRLPILRGHGGVPEDLVGVTWRDWLEDGREALLEMTADGHPAVIMGLSMGGLVALNLAAEHPTRVAGVATVAASLRFRSPLVHLLPILSRLFTFWKSSPDYADPTLAADDNNYPYFPVKTFVSLFDYCRLIEDLLPRVRAPLCIIGSRRDPAVHPKTHPYILKQAGSEHKELHWFDRSHHEMLRDCERDAVIATVVQFVQRVRAGELTRP